MPSRRGCGLTLQVLATMCVFLTAAPSQNRSSLISELAASKTLGNGSLIQPDGWARGEREGDGGPRDVTSLSLTIYSINFLEGKETPTSRARPSAG